MVSSTKKQSPHSKTFELVSKFSAAGDQPHAIEQLTEGLGDGLASQTLLGVTGSGKTFTIASVIEKVHRCDGECLSLLVRRYSV